MTNQNDGPDMDLLSFVFGGVRELDGATPLPEPEQDVIDRLEAQREAVMPAEFDVAKEEFSEAAEKRCQELAHDSGIDQLGQSQPLTQTIAYAVFAQIVSQKTGESYTGSGFVEPVRTDKNLPRYDYPQWFHALKSDLPHPEGAAIAFARHGGDEWEEMNG